MWRYNSSSDADKNMHTNLEAKCPKVCMLLQSCFLITKHAFGQVKGMLCEMRNPLLADSTMQHSTAQQIDSQLVPSSSSSCSSSLIPLFRRFFISCLCPSLSLHSSGESSLLRNQATSRRGGPRIALPISGALQDWRSFSTWHDWILCSDNWWLNNGAALLLFK